MSHFYGKVMNNRSKTDATRQGFKDSGLEAIAAGWNGAIRTEVSHKNGKDMFAVYITPWANSGGDWQLIASGELDVHNKDSIVTYVDASP